MSFVALIDLLGYKGKLRQSGVHTYSELWCEFETATGNELVLSARVDNTFDSVSWRPVSAYTGLDSWLQDIGTGTQIAWYNQMERSPSQLEALRTTPVTGEARERILGQVLTGLDDAE